MKYLLTILVFNTLFISHSFAWFHIDKKGICKSGQGFFNPEALQNTTLASCSKVSENTDVVSLKCKSDVKLFNGSHKFYRFKDQCLKYGKKQDLSKQREMKVQWQKNYNSKLWSLMSSTCSNKISQCSKSTVSTKNSIQFFTSKLTPQGYRCTNTFDHVLNSPAPSPKARMSLVCFNQRGFCSDSIFYFDSKKECMKMYKEKTK